MFEPGPVFRRAFSWLPTQFASQSDAPVGAPRQFLSTEHLSTEVISSYVDGELRMSWYMRAATHVSMCSECADAVEAQEQARAALRASRPVSMPLSLLGQLSQIPLNAPDDQSESDTRADDAGRPRRWRR
jgi:hypothetical protein